MKWYDMKNINKLKYTIQQNTQCFKTKVLQLKHYDSWHVSNVQPMYWNKVHFVEYYTIAVRPSGRVVYGIGLQPFTCWECGYESHQEHGFLSVVSVVRISATSWSLIQRSPTDCGLLLCVKQKPQEQGSYGLHWAAASQGEKLYYSLSINAGYEYY
jgi:hypothetical protein